MTGEAQQIRANPEIVIGVLQERATTDPYIREIIRSAILEAVLIERDKQDQALQAAANGEPDAADS